MTFAQNYGSALRIFVSILVISIIAGFFSATVAYASPSSDGVDLKHVPEFEGHPFSLSLEVDGSSYFESSFADTLVAASNQDMPENDYAIYIFDITDGRLISEPNSQYSPTYATHPEFQFGGPHQYQAFLAKIPVDTEGNNVIITSMDDLKEIVATSNIVSMTRKPWSVYIAEYTSEVFVYTTQGGGSYGTYLVEDATGKILWNDIDPNEPSDFPNPYDNNPNLWTTAYVAQTWLTEDGGAGKKPLTYDDLVDIQASSKNYVKPTGSGIISEKEIAGGKNLSEKCAQSCVGDPVNMGTGEFFETMTDLSFDGYGLNASASRTFSTIRKDILGPLGYGWNPHTQMSVISENNLPNLSDDSVITVNQENGSIVSFHKLNDGTYETGSKSQATLTFDKITGKYTFTREKTQVFTFDSAGKLLTQQDEFGNILTYSYNGANLSTLSDSRGNKLTYAYTSNNLLSTITGQNGQKVTYGYNTSKKLLTSVKDSRGVSYVYTYDNSRRVKTLTNALGGITTNSYDGQNRVTAQKDPLGHVLKFSYDGTSLDQTVTITAPDASKTQEIYDSGQLVQRTLGYESDDTRTWKYYYDTSGNIISTINPDTTHTGGTYDPFGNMLTSTDERGNVTRFTYNEDNKVLTVTNALGNTLTNSYDTMGNLLTSTDPQGNVTSFVYNSDGTLLKATDARGNLSDTNPDDYSTSFSYNLKGLLTQTVDAQGNKTTQEFDSLGRVQSTVIPLGYVQGNDVGDYTTSATYNSLNLPVSVTDPLGNETSLTYDKMGNILSSQDALGNITSYTYDIIGNLLTMENALNQVTTYHYDSLSQVDNIIDADGKIFIITYDNAGRIVQAEDSLGRIAKQEWDSADNLVATIDADGYRTEYTFDASGNMRTSKDANGSIISYVYDSLNRVIQVRDAEGNLTKKEYDSLNRLVKNINSNGTTETISYDEVSNPVSTTNSAGKTQTWTYDSLNRKTSYTNETGQVTSYTYDEASQLSTETRSDNSVISYSYGVTGLLDTIDYPGTESDVHYTYDALGGRVTEQKGDDEVSSTAYNAIGQIISRGSDVSKVSYTYDEVGNLETLTYPSGRVVSYSNDNVGQVTSLEIDDIGTIGYEYNNRGLLVNTTLPSGVMETNLYNDIGMLNEKNINNGENTLYRKTQTYTPNGNISQISTADSTAVTKDPKIEAYTYDPMSRVTSQIDGLDNSVINNYTYNDAGNLTGVNTKTQVFDDTGKIISSGNTNFSYDERNNRTTAIDTSTATKNMEYLWEIDDALKEVKGKEGNVSYTYDSRGLLKTRSLNGDITNTFVWDDTLAIPIMLSDGEYEYIYGKNRVPVAQVELSDGTVSYLHSDLNGSITALTDTKGVIFDTTSYSPYGTPTGFIESRFGYAGEWSDGTTGYSYLRARWLDTSTGTFLSQDPLVQATGNSFGYTNGNPLTQIDPLGLFSIGKIVSGIGDWMSDDENIAMLSNVSTALSAVGTALAVVSLIPTPISPILAISSGIIAGTGLIVGGVATASTCIKGVNASCGWGIGTTIMSAIPFGSTVGKMGKFAHRRIPKHLDVIETGRVRQMKMNSQIGWGTMQSLGLTTDLVGRKVLSNKC